jgi:ferric-chelate reductase [NAD(P)H]
MMSPIDYRAFFDLSYGLYLLTSCDGDRRNGQLVNSAFQVTAEPPNLAVVVHQLNFTHELICAGGVFALSVLAESAPLAFFAPFGFRSGRNSDKLAGVDSRTGATGCPLITEHTLSLIEAQVVTQLAIGSHTIFVGQAVRTEVLRQGRPLTYDYYRRELRGRTPASAPSYQPPQDPADKP